MHKSLVELIKDKDWIKVNAEKYLQYINNGSLKPIIPFQSAAYIILDKNEEGLTLLSTELSRIEKSPMSLPGAKVFNSIMYGYYYANLHPGKDSYYNAVQSAFEKLYPLVDDRKFMYSERARPEIIGTPFSIINSASEPVDSTVKKILQFMPSLENLNRSEKVLNQMEMSFILLNESERKVATAISDEQIKFANDQLALIAKEENEHIFIDVVKMADDAMRETYPENEPGAAIVIMRGDTILLNKGYGLADIKTNEKITHKTNFDIGSVSKMFTATAILLLQKQHKLKLEDPIIKYLPDVNPHIGNKITIYQLLTHSSGLPRYIPSKDSIQGIAATDKDSYKWEKDLDSLDFVPGTKFSYSNIGYRWLSLIIEKITGVSFQDFVRDNIFLKAGMKNSFELNKDAPIPNFAHAYKKVGKQFIEFDYGEEQLFSTLGDGGVVTSTDDLIAWEKAIRNYTILPKELFEESIMPRFNSGGLMDFGTMIPNSYYGFGWFIQNTPGSPTVYSHTGQNGAFGSYLFRIPEKKIMVALLCNRDDKNNRLGYFVKKLMKQDGWY